MSAALATAKPPPDADRDQAPGPGFPGPLLVDGHVHFYPCYDRSVFFDGALANFRAAAAALGLASGATGCLMFSETARDRYFRALRSGAGAGAAAAGPWRFERTGETDSLIALRDGGGEILLIAGHQIETAERLEVLSLGSDADIPDGLEIGPTLEAVQESGGLAVLPWGFGKWWFARGALLEAQLRTIDPAGVFLGDNGGRPGLFPSPGLFRLARERGMRILPGTDTLPLPHEAARAGRYGFVLEGAVERRQAAGCVRALARGLAAQPRVYGRLEGLGAFCRNQVMLRLRKPA